MFWAAAGLAVLGLLAMKAAPADFAAELLRGRMLSIHLLLELFAIIVGSLIIAVSWHQFGQRQDKVASALVAGFTVVVACDLMHALTYAGMPTLLTESSTPQAIFFWLMGRTAEALTLLVIAFGLMPGIPRLASLLVGMSIATALVVFGSFGLDHFPSTFVPGQGVTVFKARYEYVLLAMNLLLSFALLRRARLTGAPHYSTLATAAFVMGTGELAFTSYVAPSDFQNIFGHVYKVVAYALLYRATFITSMRAPYEELHATAQRLTQARERILSLGANLPKSAIYQVVEQPDGSMRFLEVSQSVERLTGHKVADILRDASTLYANLHPDDLAGMHARRRRSAEAGVPFEIALRLRHAAGHWLWMHLSSAPRRLEDGTTMFDGVMTDITETREADESRRALEHQLREAQKMESVGTLASGIAHDFNNVLSSIVGNAAMAKADARKGDTAQVVHAAEQVLIAAQRARDLVRQILQFSRHHQPETATQPLAPILTETVSLLRATLPAGVAVTTKVADTGIQAQVDRTQLSQVLMNLCTNAWQAMGDQGGLIELGLQRGMLDADVAIAAGTLTGPCVHLWVQDNGCGMDEVTQRRVFEPFFTTKPIGKGTGLGMAVVHGIIKSHGGGITLRSEVGVGTRFDIYLPAVAETVQKSDVAALPAEPTEPCGDGERVLYVDDDEVVAMMVERLLARAGFEACCILDPQEALALLEREPSAFRLLVTDYNMPSLSGLELIRKAKAVNPQLSALLLSGSVTEELQTLAAADGVLRVMEKQFLYEELPSAIGQAICGEKAPASA